MERKKILVCKCYSSAVNYIHDINELGFEPVLLEPYNEDEEVRKAVARDYAKGYALNKDTDYTVICEKATYEENLEMINFERRGLYISQDHGSFLVCGDDLSDRRR